MNGATEATLHELLATAQSMNINLAMLNNLVKSSGGAGGAAVSPALPTATSLNALSIAAKAAGAVFSTIGGILGKVIGGFADTGKNLVDFGKKAMEGTARLSDLFAAFKDLPFFLGSIASLFSDLIKNAEQLLGTYQNLSNSGASFGGDLFKMQQAAAAGYMSLQQLSLIVSKNSDLFATMGGNVQAGIDKFIVTHATLMGPNSPYAKSIMGLGVTADETSQYLISVMKSQGIMGRQGASDSDRLAKFTSIYITELDTLSKITGKRRDQIDAEVQKAEEDQIWQTFVDSLTPTEQEKAKLMLATAAPFGKGAVDQIKGTLRGLDTPMTEYSRNLAISSNGISLQGEEIRTAFRSTGVSVEQAGKAALVQQMNISAATGEFVDGLGTASQAAGVGIDMVSGEHQRLARILKQSNGNIDAALELAAEQQNTQQKGSAAALAAAEQNIKTFGSQISGLVSTVLAPLTNKLGALGSGITSALTSFTKTEEFKAAVEKITDWFTTTFTMLSTSFEKSGFKGLFETIVERTIDGFTSVWATIKPGLLTIWESMKPAIIKMFSEVFDLIKEAIIGPKITSANQASYEKQNELNKSVMTMSERLSTSTAEFLEGFAGMFDSEFAKRIAASRIQGQTEAGLTTGRLTGDMARPSIGASMPVPPNRATGSLGMTGNLFENFGKETAVNLHGTEAVVTPGQMSDIINNTATAGQNNLAATIEQLHSVNSQMLAYLKQTAENTRRTYDATKSLNGDLFA